MTDVLDNVTDAAPESALTYMLSHGCCTDDWIAMSDSFGMNMSNDQILEYCKATVADGHSLPDAMRELRESLNFTTSADSTFEIDPSAENRYSIVCADAVEYEEPQWTLKPYFQKGKGTLIQGDNGTGKTAFMMAIAAHISNGQPLMGLEVQSPGNVLILSVEDDKPVLRGRIEANGGNLSRCFFMEKVEELTFNSPEIEQAIIQLSAKLVIFDPLQSFLGEKVDMFKANQTRPIFARLFEMCSRNDCACAIVSHTGKASKDKSFVNRALGSVDIPASMRSILQLGESPDVPGEKIMVHIKCSNAPKGKSIAYTIGDRGGVTWAGFSDLTIEDLAFSQRRKDNNTPYDQDPLVELFNQLFEDNNGNGFWTYSEVEQKSRDIIGYTVRKGDIKKALDGGLQSELLRNDGLRVTYGEKAHGNVRGIKIERYKTPQGYQLKIAGG